MLNNRYLRCFVSVFLFSVICLSHNCPNGTVYAFQECKNCNSFVNTIASQKLTNACTCAVGYKWSQQSVACIKPFNLKTVPQIIKQGKLFLESVEFVKTSARLLATACDTSNGFILKNNLCINCRDIPWSSGTAKDISTCNCQSPTTWSSYYQFCACQNVNLTTYYINASSSCNACKQISNISTSSQCYSCNGGSFGYSFLGCVNCSSIPYGDGATPSSTFGICKCKIGYTFNLWLGTCICNIYGKYAITSSNTCQACITLPSTSSTNCFQCTNSFFYSGYVCKDSSLIGNYDSTLKGCPINHALTTNPLTNQTTRCVCSNAAGYYTNSGVCSSCADSTNLAACSNCDPSAGFFLAAQQCIYCANAPYSTATATVSSCLCQTNYYWSVITSSCQCDWALGFFGTPGLCISCSSLPYTKSTPTVAGCTCVTGYIWSQNQCVCDPNPLSGAFMSSLGQCINCNIMLGAYPIVTANRSSCVCLQGRIWDLSIQQCVCDFNQNFWQINGICYDCNALANTVGTATASGCQCGQNFIWDITLNICNCPIGYINMGTYCGSCSTISLPTGVTIAGCQACNVSQGLFLSGGICYACSSQKYSTGAATASGCTCTNSSFVWSKTLNGCTCNSPQANITSFASGSLACVACLSTSCTCGFPGTGTTYNMGVCTFCSGIQNSNGLITNGVCGCITGYAFSVKTYPNTCYCSYRLGYYISTTCKSCAALPYAGTVTSSGCLLCSSSQGFLYLSNDTCLQCSSVPGTNGIATAVGCQCTTGVWNSLLLQCVSITCPVGYIYNSQFLITSGTGTSCVICSTIYLSTGVTTSTTACECSPGYNWTVSNSGVGSCISCNSTTSVFLGSLCYSCLTVQFSTGPVVGTANCACPSALVWTIVATNNTGACICSDPLQIPTVDVSSCICNPAYAIAGITVACIDCRTIPYSINVTASGVCGCMPNFVWTNTSSPACLCLTPYMISSGQCVCNPAISINFGGFCFVCANVVNSTAASTGTACICQPYNTWDGMSCVSTCNSTSVLISNSANTSIYTCFNCESSGTYTLAKLNATVCSCSDSGLFWNAQGYCDCGTSAMIITGSTYVCVLCNSAIYSTGQKGSYACTCPTPLVWNATTNACDCGPSAMIKFSNSVYSCLACNDSIYSSGISNNTCNCLGSLTWNIVTNACDCGTSAVITSAYACVVCNSSVYSTGKSLVRNICNCLGSLTWNILTNACDCGTSAVITSANTCVVCDSTIFSSGMSSTNNICICLGSLTWQGSSCGCTPPLIFASNNNCVLPTCNSTSVILPNLSCVGCTSTIYALSVLNSNTCNCLSSALVWNKTFGMCVCKSSTAIIFVLGNNFYCMTCSSAVYATVPSTPTSCACMSPNITWNSTLGTCTCNSTAAVYIQGTNFICTNCNSAVYASSKLNTTACKCIDSSFSWNGTACVCPAGSIIAPNFKCFACPSGATIGSLICNCSTAASPNSFWNDITKTCVACGTSAIPNSMASFFGVACRCISGYVWDVMTNGCIVSAASYTMNCLSIPNLLNLQNVKKPLALVGNRKIIPSSSAIIQNYYLNISSDYAILANNAMACICQSGTCWNSITMRCYNTTFSLQG